MKRLSIAIVLVFVTSVIASVWWINRFAPNDVAEAAKEPNPYFFNQRAFPKGQIDLAALNTARLQAVQMRGLLPRGGQPVWQQRGPLNVQGRITDLAVDPRDQNIAYAAAAEGGIFRTTDGGASWTPLFDNMPSLSMGTVALDSTNPNVVFAGTGEVNPGGGSMAYGGTGLYRSDDQGDTWTFVGLEDSGSIGRVVVHPTNPDIIHVAVMGHIWSPGPNRGVYRTTDGGNTWSRALFVNDTTGCVDIIQRPDNPDVLLAAMWQRTRQPEYYDYGGTGCGVYRSTDAGVTWSLVGGGLPGTSSNRGRIGLALCAINPNVMCAIYADRTGFFDGLYRSTNGGSNWTRTNDGGLSGAYASYGWWFGNVRIHPQDANTIFVVGFDLYRSTNAGGSYSIVGGSMHVDHHGLAFGSGANPQMYDGNDGGVYTSNNGSTWTKTTGAFPITQAYRIATAPWDEDALWLGTQDNGTSVDLEGDGNFNFIYGGDGFQPLPHRTNPNRVWAQSQYGGVAYSSNGGSGWSGATSGLNGRFNWNAPHAQDPNNPETRYFGTNRVHRNSGNTSWTAISNDLTGGPHQGNAGQVDGTLTTINVSPADSGVIWSGSDDGRVYVTQNGGTAWTNVSAGLPQRWITSVRPHPTAASEALVSVSGFRWGEDIAHVYHTANFGATWTPLDGNLPDAPVNDVWIDPVNATRYFAATDVGVFESIDGGAAWSPYGIGLPNVVVNDFAYQAATRELFAGTYGRSIFSISLDAGDPTALVGLEMVTGTILSGGLNELLDSDDKVLITRSGFGSTFVDLHHMEMIVAATTTVGSPTAIDLTIESNINHPTGIAQVRLRNWDTGQFEQVDQYAIGANQEVRSIEDIPAGNYVDANGIIDLSIKHIVFVPFLAFAFESSVDFVDVVVE